MAITFLLNERLQGQIPGRFYRALRTVAGTVLLATGLIGSASAATSNVASTAHNLSKNGTGTVKSDNQTQICVFCHTPHNSNATLRPLWNRNTTAPATYTPYNSSSLDSKTITAGFTGQPGGSSLLCLSCHDGLIALGDVNVSIDPATGKSGTADINVNGGNADKTMPDGTYGATSGFTRRIGTNLSNDHPISVTYSKELADRDNLKADQLPAGEEMRTLDTSQNYSSTLAPAVPVIGLRRPGFKPLLPLMAGPDGLGQVQCATCHDPHITAAKFLRLNRFQTNAGPALSSGFKEADDQICLACHPKLRDIWAESAHANSTVADEVYLATASTVRGFPPNKKVWEIACLNCHDTHSVQGSRRLLREGVESTLGGTLDGSYQGGSTNTTLNKVSAIENTCYQCHSAVGGTRVIGTAAGSSVPDIKTSFTTAGNVRMPMTTAAQGSDPTEGQREIHDITNADFMETPESLGKGKVKNRHVECTDCHNPHRVRRNSTFYGVSTDANSAKRTHDVGGLAGNVASGVLRGAWGVEPVFGIGALTNWPQLPTGYDIKQGDPGTQNSTLSSAKYLTREYQLCLKCHSDYSNTPGQFPLLGNTLNGTPTANNNGLTTYTNVAAEFGSVKATNPPTTGTDQGEESNSGTACGGADCDPTPSLPGGANNHRSWHPVMFPTGRDMAERSMSGTTLNLRAPFNANIGKQTMYCSDCHGDPASWTQNTGPNTAVTQGPHGSPKPFLLKGDWNLPASGTGQTPNSPGVCGNCHNPTGGSSGFRGDRERARHSADVKQGKPCNFCHIAVPHGWKNKAFLVNLNCVGPESGDTTLTYNASGCASKAPYYSAQPYYRRAVLKVSSWARSGSWSDSNCSGKEWMTNTCDGGA